MVAPNLVLLQIPLCQRSRLALVLRRTRRPSATGACIEARGMSSEIALRTFELENGATSDEIAYDRNAHRALTVAKPWSREYGDR